MRKFDVEVAVGVFMILGALCLGYLSIKLGETEFLGPKGYDVYGLFSETGGLRTNSAVVIAGVGVGSVKAITLDDYEARVVMRIDRGIQLQEDAIASIKTRGLIGEKYVEITPGGSEKLIGPGGRIRETESAVDLESLISKYVFGKM